MSNVSQWSTTDASNNSAAPDGAPESTMTVPQLNDTLRAIMGGVARFYEHVDGSLVTAGSSNAFTIDTNSDHAALADQSVIIARADRAPTGAATLKVDALDAKSIKVNHSEDVTSDTWDAGQMLAFVYNATDDIYEVIGPSIPADGTITEAKLNSTITPTPQGYLTLVSGTPAVTSDQASKTSVYYTPDVGNKIPLYNGTRFEHAVFAELTLALATQHLASNLYDVFIFDDSGTVRIGTGPTWTAGAVSGSITAGSCARGTGAASTELTRVLGFLVNANSITLRNGADTYSVDANKATYVGSLFIDGTAGQITCHTSYGQSRKWGVWNAYNRRLISLKGGDPTASWSYTTATVRPSNNDTTNSLTPFFGLPDGILDAQLTQRVQAQTNNSTVSQEIGIGYNSTSTTSGQRGFNGLQNNVTNNIFSSSSATARFARTAELGIHTVTSLEITSGAAALYYGSETYMLLSAQWAG